MNITPYIYKEDKRIVDKSSYLTQILPATLRPIVGTMREPLDVLYPVVTLDLTAIGEAGYRDPMITSFNYAYILELGRYYYVRKKEVLNNLLLRVYFEVDPLFSHKSDITALSCLVDRSESDYDILLQDDIYPFDLKKEIYQVEPTATTNVNLKFTGEFTTGDENIVLSESFQTGTGITVTDTSSLNLPTVDTKYFSDAGGTMCYLLDKDQLAIFVLELMGDMSKYSTFFKNIVAYPFKLTSTDPTGSIVIYELQQDGTYQQVTFTAQGKFISSNSAYYCVSEFTLPTAQAFFDYEPYSNYELYLPFHGWISLPYAEHEGSTIRVLYNFNHQDGSANIAVYDYTQGRMIYSTSAQVGVRLSVTSTNAQQNLVEKQSAQLNLLLGLVGSGLGAVGSVATGNVMGVALSGVGIASSVASYVSKTNMMFLRAQSTPNGAVGALFNPLKVAWRKTFMKKIAGQSYSEFIKFNGGVCRKVKTLSSLTGFTIISNPILSGFDSAMEEEKNIIIGFMKTGIIL